MHTHQHYQDDRYFMSLLQQVSELLRNQISRLEKQRDMVLIVIFGVIPLMASIWLQAQNFWSSYAAEIVFGTLGLFAAGAASIQYYQSQLLKLSSWFRIPLMLDNEFTEVLRHQLQSATGHDVLCNESISAIDSQRLPLIEIVLTVFYSEGVLPGRFMSSSPSDTVRKLGMLNLTKLVKKFEL